MALVEGSNRKGYFGDLPLLKKLFWLYFFLLIFEGALRKWVIPQLSAPLLIVRDPISLWIIWEAYRTHKWPTRWSVITGILTAGFFSLCIAQVVVGDNPWFVGLYGLRSYLLPFPVALIMGESLDSEDLRHFGNCTLWLMLPLAGIEILQYLSSPTSWWNKGAYAGAGQIAYTGDHVRASGTWSYVMGPVCYGPLVAAFVLYGLVKERFAKRWIIWAAAFALIVSVPVTGARTLVFELIGLLACMVVGAFLGVSQFGRTLRVVVPVLLVGFLVSLLPIFSDASSSLVTRFTQADRAEGGSISSAVEGRTIGNIEAQLESTDFGSNWLGAGIGRGSAAMVTLTSGRASFVSGEDEFSRELNELGPFPGALFWIFKIFMATYFLGRAVARARDQDPLALLLAPPLFFSLVFGVLEQPTVQGFMVIDIAFILAALNRTDALSISAIARFPQWGSLRPQVRVRRRAPDSESPLAH